VSCACGQHKTPQGCAGARHMVARPEIRTKPKQRPPRVLLSKPCARGGCTGAVTAYGEKTLMYRDYCSQRCAYLERRRRGTWPPYVLTTEERRRGAQMSGRLVGARRAKQAMVAAAERAMRFLPEDVVDVLTREQLLRLKVGVAHACMDAYDTGYRRGYGPRGQRRPRTEAA
jgi:hypothetical protein